MTNVLDRFRSSDRSSQMLIIDQLWGVGVLMGNLATDSVIGAPGSSASVHSAG